MSDEKSKTMEERIAPLIVENERIAQFDQARRLRPGQLTPRQRVEALVDPGSLLEIARLAHSQFEEVGELTVADGVIAAYGAVDGHGVAMIAEDALALAATDRQVGKNKRLRLIDHAVFRRLPLVYIADGAEATSHRFDPARGMLITRIAEQIGARDVSERRAPFVSVILGPCYGQDAALAVRADVVIATPAAQITVADRAPQPVGAVADLVATSDAAALDAAKVFLRYTTARQLQGGRFDVSRREASRLTDHDCDVPAERLAEGLADADSLLRFGADSDVVTGLATVFGKPVALAVTAGGRARSLTTADVLRVRRVAEISSRFGLPLVTTQDVGGYDPASAADPLFVTAVAETVELLRRSTAPKICLVTGSGHVLGDHILGGAGVDFDFTWAWASATIGLHDTSAYGVTETDDVGPWAAADFGILDDVVKPSESRVWLGRALRLLSRVEKFPEAPLDRGQRFYDMV